MAPHSSYNEETRSIMNEFLESFNPEAESALEDPAFYAWQQVVMRKSVCEQALNLAGQELWLA